MCILRCDAMQWLIAVAKSYIIELVGENRKSTGGEVVLNLAWTHSRCIDGRIVGHHDSIEPSMEATSYIIRFITFVWRICSVKCETQFTSVEKERVLSIVSIFKVYLKKKERKRKNNSLHLILLNLYLCIKGSQCWKVSLLREAYIKNINRPTLYRRGTGVVFP